MNLDDIPEAVRAEMDGKRAEPPTFVAWMGAMTEREQDRLFGARKAALFRAGKISQRRLLNQENRPLPIREYTEDN